MNENTCGEIAPFFPLLLLPAAYFLPFRCNRKIKNIKLNTWTLSYVIFFILNFYNFIIKMNIKSKNLTNKIWTVQ